MKRAWQIYRNENRFSTLRSKYEFKWALIRAWKEEKRNIEMQNRPAKVTKVYASCGYGSAIAASYSNARQGQYFGD